MTVIAFRPRDRAIQEARAAELPHRKEYANPSDQRIGSPLGRAAIMGLINQAEFDAGVRWGECHSDYINTITSPEDRTQATCERAVDEYMRGIHILEKHPKRVFHAVMALAAYGEDWGDLEYVARAAQIGFDALAREF